MTSSTWPSWRAHQQRLQLGILGSPLLESAALFELGRRLGVVAAHSGDSGGQEMRRRAPGPYGQTKGKVRTCLVEAVVVQRPPGFLELVKRPAVGPDRDRHGGDENENRHGGDRPAPDHSEWPPQQPQHPTEHPQFPPRR